MEEIRLLKCDFKNTLAPLYDANLQLTISNIYRNKLFYARVGKNQFLCYVPEHFARLNDVSARFRGPIRDHHLSFVLLAT